MLTRLQIVDMIDYIGRTLNKFDAELLRRDNRIIELEKECEKLRIEEMAATMNTTGDIIRLEEENTKLRSYIRDKNQEINRLVLENHELRGQIVDDETADKIISRLMTDYDEAWEALSNRDHNDEFKRKELNALIAEKCFGWEWWAFDTGIGLGRLAGIVPPNPPVSIAKHAIKVERDDYRWLTDWDTVSGNELPDYIGNANYTREVTNWIIEKRDMFELYYNPFTELWTCGYASFSHATGKTEGEAICRAALEIADKEKNNED